MSLILVILANVDFTSNSWVMYLSNKLPQAWINLCLVFVTVFVVDWILPGETLSVIMGIDRNSSWQEKLCAAILTSTFALVAVLAVTART